MTHFLRFLHSLSDSFPTWTSYNSSSYLLICSIYQIYVNILFHYDQLYWLSYKLQYKKLNPNNLQIAQLSQRDRAAGCVSGRNISGSVLATSIVAELSTELDVLVIVQVPAINALCSQTSANIAISHIILLQKTRFLGLPFCCISVSVIFNHLEVIKPYS